MKTPSVCGKLPGPLSRAVAWLPSGQMDVLWQCSGLEPTPSHRPPDGGPTERQSLPVLELAGLTRLGCLVHLCCQLVQKAVGPQG